MGWVVNATPRPLYPRERPYIYCIGGWAGPRAGLDRCGKSRPSPEFNPRTIQPVASRYTDWAISAHPILILSPHLFLRLPNFPLHSVFPHQNTLCLSSPPHTRHISRLLHLPWFEDSNNTSAWEVQIMRLLIYSFFQSPVTSSLLGPNIFLSTFFTYQPHQPMLSF
jgi:hypothetical protein